MRLCELPIGHAGPHQTSVERAERLAEPPREREGLVAEVAAFRRLVEDEMASERGEVHLTVDKIVARFSAWWPKYRPAARSVTPLEGLDVERVHRITCKELVEHEAGSDKPYLWPCWRFIDEYAALASTPASPETSREEEPDRCADCGGAYHGSICLATPTETPEESER
jgi:hypothetical protein